MRRTHRRPANKVVRHPFLPATITEWAILATLIAVPLAVVSPGLIIWNYEVPKITLLRLAAGGVAAAWLADVSVRQVIKIKRGLAGPAQAESPSGSLRNPVVIAAAAFFIANILSWAFSLSPHISMWGGLPHIDGYALVNTIAYGILFLSAAMTITAAHQVNRMLLVLAANGTLVALFGIAEFYAIVPIDWLRPETRIQSTIGNPIFVGTFLNLSIIATVVLGLRNEHATTAKLIMSSAQWGLPIGMQLLATFITLSRGPWLGLAVGALVLFTMGWYLQRSVTGAARAMAALFVISLVIAVSLAAVLGTITGREQGLVASVAERAVDTSSPGRLEIWKATGSLIANRPVPEYVADKLPPARYLVGYGPALFRWVYPQTSARETTVVRAHNHFLQIAVELGIIGMVSFMVLIVVTLLASLPILESATARTGPNSAWLVAGLMAMIMGWAVTSSVSIPKASDLAVLWISIGAISGVSAGTNRSAGLGRQPPFPKAKLVLSLVGFLVILWLMWLVGVKPFIGATYASDGSQATASGQYAEAESRLANAINNGPKDSTYYLMLAEAQARNTGADPTRQELTSALTAARNTALEPLKFNRLDAAAIRSVAAYSVRLGDLGHDDMRRDAVLRYQQLVELQPAEWTAWDNLARGLLTANEPERAMPAIARSLAITEGFPEAAHAHLIQGQVYIALDDLARAKVEIETSLALGGLSPTEEELANRLAAAIDDTAP